MELTIMTGRRLHNLPILGLLLLCLLTSPARTFGYVWCVSADGHATLEEAVAGDCGLNDPAPATDGSTTLSLTADADDCGSCLDIASTPRWGSARTRNTDTPVNIPAPLAPVLVARHLFLPDRLTFAHIIADLAPRTPEPLRHHRTVVLLI